MQTYIALFRGINVGGKNILPMKELRDLLNGLGLQNVTGYNRRGNVIFQTDRSDSEKYKIIGIFFLHARQRRICPLKTGYECRKTAGRYHNGPQLAHHQ